MTRTTRLKQTMATKVTIQPSGNPKKKLDAIVEEPGRRAKTVSFGQKGAQDFTTHKDPDRKEQYLKRRQAREDWKDPRTAGFWAAHLLWNKVRLRAPRPLAAAQ